MPQFDLTADGWTEIVAAGGTTTKEIRVSLGEALVRVGPSGSAVQRCGGSGPTVVYAPAGVAVNVRPVTGRIIVALGDSSPIGGVLPPDTIAPTITSTASHNVLENTPYAAVATANEAVTWAKGGTDAALVTLNPATGAWSVAAQDYETRTSLVFTLTATDLAGNASAAQAVTLTIGDVADGAVLPATQTVAFGSLTRVAMGGHPLGYTGSGFLGITSGNAADHWQIVDNRLCPKNGAGAWGTTPPTYAGPYTLGVAEYSDAGRTTPTGVSTVATVNMVANVAHCAAGSASRPDDYANATTGLQLNYMLNNAVRVPRGTTIMMRDGAYTSGFRFRPPAGGYTGSGRITIRSETVDVSVNPTTGQPNYAHGFKIASISADSASSGDILFPIDFESCQYESAATTGSPSFVSYNASGFGMRVRKNRMVGLAAVPGTSSVNAIQVRSGPSGTGDDVAIIEDNYIQGVGKAMQLLQGVGTTVRRNYCDSISSDFIQEFSGSRGSIVTDNFVATMYPQSGDHPDFYQHQGATTQDIAGPTLERNVIVYNGVGGSGQGMFLDDTVAPYKIQGAVCRNNLFIIRYLNGASFTYCDDIVVERSTIIGDITGPNTSSIRTTSGAVGNNIRVEDCVTNSIAVNNQGGTNIQTRITLLPFNLTAYQTMMPGYVTGGINNIQQAMNAYAPARGLLESAGGAMNPGGTYRGALFPINDAGVATWNTGGVFTP